MMQRMCPGLNVIARKERKKIAFIEVFLKAIFSVNEVLEILSSSFLCHPPNQ